MIALLFSFDRVDQRDRAWLADILGERLFGPGAPEAAVALLEGMDAFKPLMPKRRMRQCGQWRGPSGAVRLNQSTKTSISPWTCAEDGAFEMHGWSIDATRGAELGRHAAC